MSDPTETSALKVWLQLIGLLVMIAIVGASVLLLTRMAEANKPPGAMRHLAR